MPHHCLYQREEIRRLTKKCSVKTNNGPRERENKDKYQSVISEVEELKDLKGLTSRVSCFSAGQVRTPA